MTLTRFTWLAWRRNPEFAALVRKNPEEVKTIIEETKELYYVLLIGISLGILSFVMLRAAITLHDNEGLMLGGLIGFVALGFIIYALASCDLGHEEQKSAKELMYRLKLTEKALGRRIGKKDFRPGEAVVAVGRMMGGRASDILKLQEEESQYTYIDKKSKPLREKWEADLKELGKMHESLSTRPCDYFRGPAGEVEKILQENGM
jgi:hypothetical protein